jgi:hypothetical protein
MCLSGTTGELSSLVFPELKIKTTRRKLKLKKLKNNDAEAQPH